MSLWLVRAGKHGQHEKAFLDEGRIYLTWGNLNCDLGALATKADLKTVFNESYPDTSAGKRRNHIAQVWAFAHRIQTGDWIALPSKLKRSVIHFGECASDYKFDAKAKDGYEHFRKVTWFAPDIPRSRFDQDILYSLGAFLTVCEIKRNDAEKRVRAMSDNDWKTAAIAHPIDFEPIDADSDESFPADLEVLASDQIAKQLIAKFKGHGMASLVDAILKAQGYATFVSPPGPDGGVDILAAPGAMGFGNPRLCVQVKSSDGPSDLPTLNQLLGTMQNVHAEQGLLVSWGGFKSSVDKERASQFFRVRLWDQQDLIEQLLAHYDRLDEDLRAEIPLKRIWTLAAPDDATSESA